MGILYLNYKRVIIRPPGKRHLNGVSLTCLWWPNIECWRGSFQVCDFQGVRASIGKKPCVFVIFQGGGSGSADGGPTLNAGVVAL